MISNLNSLQIVATILSAIVSIFLLVSVRILAKTDAVYKKFLIFAVSTAFLAVIFYMTFFLTKDYEVAMRFDELYFICTDWMAYSMFIFGILYVDSTLKLKKTKIIFTLLALVDSINVILNERIGHLFKLSFIVLSNGFSYWSLELTPFHYIHLGFCYIMVMATFLHLLLNSIKSPKIYKMKYLGIFFAYLIVIIVNFISYNFDLPIDGSVFLYAILTGFIVYYSVFNVPKQFISGSLRCVNDTLTDGIAYFDMDGKVVFFNKTLENLIPLVEDNFLKSVSSYRYKSQAYRPRKDGIIKWEEDVIVRGTKLHIAFEYKLLNYGESIIGSYLKVRDLTEHMNRFNVERFYATHDSLTLIYNRERFFDVCNKILSEEDYTPRLMLASNIIDFKLVNEIFGDAKADSILVRQADLIKELAHEDTVYGRIGDDKFALMLKVEHFDKQEFLDSIKDMMTLTEGSLYQMYVKIGVCEIHPEDKDSQVLYDKANMAIEATSENYSKVFAYYDSSLMDKLLMEKNIAVDFEQALEEKQFEMYLQAILDKNGDLKGAEALVRWNHPIKGVVLPEDFLSVLKKTGLIHRLDIFIWEQAVKTLVSWRISGNKDKFITVNVSSEDFYYLDISDFFMNLVHKYEVNPRNIKLEFPEEIIASDFDKASEVFKRLQRQGFDIIIDDFGQENSSLNLLKDVQVDIIKIDSVFINNISNFQRSKIVLEFMIEIAAGLGIKVACERVETEAQYDNFKELSCELFQGEYLDEPLSVLQFNKKYF